MNDLIINELGITERKETPVVSSRKVAEKFGKRHEQVLRAITTATDPKYGLSEKFAKHNFVLSSYKDSTGRRLPEYLLTRDGFSYIAMGFTGKRSAQFKEAYITAFNQMESFIKNLLEAKADFPEFTDAIMAAHEEPKHYHFSNECDMINTIVLGMSARKFKEINCITVKSIRPYLSIYQIEMIKTLQRIDIGLIVAIPDFQQRKALLTQQLGRKQTKQLSQAI